MLVCYRYLVYLLYPLLVIFVQKYDKNVNVPNSFSIICVLLFPNSAYRSKVRCRSVESQTGKYRIRIK